MALLPRRLLIKNYAVDTTGHIVLTLVFYYGKRTYIFIRFFCSLVVWLTKNCKKVGKRVSQTILVPPQKLSLEKYSVSL